MKQVPVYIVYSGIDAEDEALACRLHAGVSAGADKQLLVAQAVIARGRRQQGAAWFGHVFPLRKGAVARHGLPYFRITVLPGVTVAVLSRAMLDNEACRTALIEGVAAPRHFSFRHYYVCRDVSVEAIRASPLGSSILDTGVVVDERDVAQVLDDLNGYLAVDFAPGGNPFTFGYVIRALGIPVSVGLGVLFSLLPPFLYRCRLLFVAALAAVLYWDAAGSWTWLLIVAGFYDVGLGLNYIDSLDLWPWLDRQWKLPASVDLAPTRMFGFGPIAVWGLIIGGLLSRTMDGAAPGTVGAGGLIAQLGIDCLALGIHLRRASNMRACGDLPRLPTGPSDTICSLARLRAALGCCSSVRRVLVYDVLSIQVILLMLCLGAAHLLVFAPVAYVVAFLAGLLSPAASRWFMGSVTGRVARKVGLMPQNLKYTSGITDKLSRGPSPFSLGESETPLDGFTEDERAQMMRWSDAERRPFGLRSRWFAAADYAFISYAWSDDLRLHMADRLAGALTEIGVDYYRDKESGQRFVGFQEHLAPAMGLCTHLFLVVSPGIVEGDIINREVRAALNRWSFEALPAIVCIAEPETARALQRDARVPLEVRFALTKCPMMSFEEALDPAALRYVIGLTRRQGKLADWLTVLSGAMAPRRILYMPGIATAD